MWPPNERTVTTMIDGGNVALAMAIPVTVTGPKGERLTVYVDADAVAVRDNSGQWLRLTCAQACAQKVADVAGRMLLLPAIVAARDAACTRRAPILPQPTDAMVSERTWRHYEESLIKRGFGWSPWETTAGTGKDYVLVHRLQTLRNQGEYRCAIYGWAGPDGVMVQDVSTAHSWLYWDYSHKVHTMALVGELDGARVELAELVTDPAWGEALGAEGSAPPRWP